MPNHSLRGFNPIMLGAACAIGAVLLGLAYLFVAGAPAPMLAVNLVALILGLTAMALQMRNRNCDDAARFFTRRSMCVYWLDWPLFRGRACCWFQLFMG